MIIKGIPANRFDEISHIVRKIIDLARCCSNVDLTIIRLDNNRNKVLRNRTSVIHRNTFVDQGKSANVFFIQPLRKEYKTASRGQYEIPLYGTDR